MTSIDLTKEQVEELKSFYKLELERSFKRTTEIIAILDKLESKPELIVNPESISKPVVQELKPEKKLLPAVQQDGKYVKWSDAIIELFREKQKPMSFKEISKILLAQKNIPKADIIKSNYAIRQSIYRLRTKNNMIQSITKSGKKGILFGLSEWGVNTGPEKSVETKLPKLKQKKSIPVINKEVKIRNPKQYNWQDFIKETLESKKRVLSLGELANVALKHFELKSTEKTRTKANLAPVLTKLVQKDKILKTVKKKGISGRSYGFKGWFDESGNLVSIYK